MKRLLSVVLTIVMLLQMVAFAVPTGVVGDFDFFQMPLFSEEAWSEQLFKTAKRPEFTSPAANSMVSPENLTISWTNNSDAEYYGIKIKDSSGNVVSGYDEKKVNTNSITVNLDYDETYTVGVYALLGGQTIWTASSLVFETESEDALDGDVIVDATAHMKINSEVVATKTTPATVTVTLQMLGDINLDDSVDMNDAILLLQYSMFPDLYPIDYKGSVDFTKDGSVDMNDAILLLQYSMFPDLYPIE